MCGITGIWNLYSQETADTGLLKAMCDATEHRGPDGEGVEVLGPVGLGHRRLSIVDLAHGRQPLSDREGRVWVTFNGEIYNYQKLREEFEQDGIIFKTNCDTEVIPYCYIKYGLDFAAKLEGMFAIAIWDQLEKRLLLLRDRLGKKPLLYFNTASGIVFASEMQALNVHPAFSSDISPEGLDAFLTLGYVPHTLSVFSQVKKVAPAELLVIDNAGKQTSHRYWSNIPQALPADLSLSEAKRELDTLLQHSVGKRLISDVPLGAFLSGGTDSSLIAAIASKCSPGKLKTFCIGFDENDFDERKDASAVAEILETEHHEEKVTFDGLEVLPGLQKHFGEPFADASAIPTFYLCKHLKQDVTVALSGDGGDELFLGYSRYQRLAKRYKIHKFVSQIPGNSFLAESSRRRGVRRQGAIGRVVNTLEDSGLTASEQFLVSSTVFSKSARAGLYNIKYRDSFVSDVVERRVNELFQRFESETFEECVGLVDQNLYMVDDILSKVDIASMAASLEVRAPLLDHSVVEFAAGLPLKYKQSNQGGKIILKSLLSDYIPQQLVDKPKQGFGVPVADWLRTSMLPMAKELLLSPSGFIAEHFDQKVIHQLLDEHVSRTRCNRDQLYPLICLGLWADQLDMN